MCWYVVFHIIVVDVFEELEALLFYILNSKHCKYVQFNRYFKILECTHNLSNLLNFLIRLDYFEVLWRKSRISSFRFTKWVFWSITQIDEVPCCHCLISDLKKMLSSN